MLTSGLAVPQPYRLSAWFANVDSISSLLVICPDLSNATLAFEILAVTLSSMCTVLERVLPRYVN